MRDAPLEKIPVWLSTKECEYVLRMKTKLLILFLLPLMGGMAVVGAAFGVSMSLIHLGYHWKIKSIQDMSSGDIGLCGTLLGGLPAAAVIFYCVRRISKRARKRRAQQSLEIDK